MKNLKTVVSKFIFSLSALAALSFCVGCQSQDTPKKTGTYTAARRPMIGSNIPQPYSADTANSTVDDSFMRDTQRANNSAGAMSAAAGRF